MSRRGTLRQSRLMHAAVGATIVAGPASAALADAGPALQAHLKTHRLRFGQAVVVEGRAPSSDGGQAVNLEFAPAGGASWQPVAAGHISPDGSFRLTAPLRSSGSVRVTMSTPPASPLAAAASSAGTSSTAPQHVAVAAALRTRRHNRDVLGARTIDVKGQLLPRVGHHWVLLQGRRGARWVTLARRRTRSDGAFSIRYRASAPGREPLRVRFPGNGSNTATASPAGSVTVLHPTVASWYDDAGTTACGFHAYYGVANLSLPCGARVSFRRGGHTVTAVVDDRGPYVGGREWDLNQNTAAALGFGGVGTVWASR
jgi:peptidoglycan lytic transglycosylase